MLLDDTWLSDKELFEFFKVYSAYNLGLCSYSNIMKNTQDWRDIIFNLRLAMIRNYCDRAGGPELFPLSSASR